MKEVVVFTTHSSLMTPLADVIRSFMLMLDDEMNNEMTQE